MMIHIEAHELVSLLLEHSDVHHVSASVASQLTEHPGIYVSLSDNLVWKHASWLSAQRKYTLDKELSARNARVSNLRGELRRKLALRFSLMLNVPTEELESRVNDLIRLKLVSVVQYAGGAGAVRDFEELLKANAELEAFLSENKIPAWKAGTL